MARKQAASRTRAGRLLRGAGVLFGLTFLGEQTSDASSTAGKWKPELGLDLQGGTRITLSATNDPTRREPRGGPQHHRPARQRLRCRRGRGHHPVAASFIIVEIPGDPRSDLVDTVKRQAQLRFRLVACSLLRRRLRRRAPPTPPRPTDPTPRSPARRAASRPPSAGASASGSPSDGATAGAQRGRQRCRDAVRLGQHRAGARYDGTVARRRPRARPPSAAPERPTRAPTRAARPAPPTPARTCRDATASPQGRAPIEPPDGGDAVDDPLTWSRSPNQAAIDAFNAFTCPTDGSRGQRRRRPRQAAGHLRHRRRRSASSTCSPPAHDRGHRPRATPRAGIPQNQASWAVNLAFDGAGTKDVHQDLARRSYGTERQFAIVLDGQVLSAPTMDGVITNGQAQITGNFNQATAPEPRHQPASSARCRSPSSATPPPS